MPFFEVGECEKSIFKIESQFHTTWRCGAIPSHRRIIDWEIRSDLRVH